MIRRRFGRADRRTKDPCDEQNCGSPRAQTLKLAHAFAGNPRPLEQNDNSVDLDEELFSAIGAQLGSSNETLRNLLLNANHKISELDAIKEAVAKLVSPVSKALREFETEKADKINLQAAFPTPARPTASCATK